MNMTRKPGRVPDARAVAVAVVFALSGVAGLSYEIVWVRQVTLLIGSTAWAVSLTIAGFLLGLTLGALLGGRLADRSRNWLFLYAAFEVAVGVLGVGLTELLAGLGASSGASLGIAGAQAALRIALTALLLLPPTIAMGATLPVLTRWVARSLPQLGQHFTVLYALNTLGAAGGCVLAGFVAVPGLGLVGTAWLAAGVNLVAAASAVALGLLERRSAPREEGPASPKSSPGEASEDREAATAAGDARVGLDARGRRVLVFVFAGTGFLAIAYEVLWFRSLGLFVRSSVYAFTALLSIYLLGLVIGAAVYALVLQPRKQDLKILALAQVVQALAGLVSLALLTNGRAIDFVLGEALGSNFAALWVQALLVLLIPASIIGVTFPLVVQATATHIERVGQQVGWLYSVNTLGGIAGSVAVGFVLVPTIGTQWTFVLLALAGAAIAVRVITLDASADRAERRKVFVAAALVLPAAFLLPPGTFLEAYADPGPGELLRVVEGRDGTIAVIEYSAKIDCARGPCADHCRKHPYRHRQIRYGSMSYASTIMPARRYMSALANLAMLTGPPAKKVLIVAFGTGTTAGTVILHPELEALTIVDINQDVIDASVYFEESNHRVLHDPRTEVVIDDARHFLASVSPERKWDVISFEPPPPSAPGVVNLYSREFYALAKRHLTPGGRLTQWVPFQEQSPVVNRMLARSLVDVFAEVSLWFPSRFEGVYLASDEPLVLDFERLAGAFELPKLKAGLLEAGMVDPYDLLEAFTLGPKALRRWCEEVRPVTDDEPAVEYYLSYDSIQVTGPMLFDLAESPAPWITGAFDRETLARRLENAHRYRDTEGLIRDERYLEAASVLDALIAVEGETPWLHFLRRDELECILETGLPPSTPPAPKAVSVPEAATDPASE